VPLRTIEIAGILSDSLNLNPLKYKSYIQAEFRLIAGIRAENREKNRRNSHHSGGISS
jgi:hypothetical protein